MEVDLSTCMMYADVSVHRWSGRRTDKRITRDVLNDHQMKEGSGAFVRYLIPKMYINALCQIEYQIRKEFNNRTIHGFGFRMLHTKDYFDTKLVMDELIAKYDQEATAIAHSWDLVLDQARDMLGDSFNPALYPTAERFYHATYAEFRVSPMAPDVSKLSLPDTQLEEMRTNYERQQQNLKRTVTEAYAQEIADLLDEVNARESRPTVHQRRRRNRLIGQRHARYLVDLPGLDEQLQRLHNV